MTVFRRYAALLRLPGATPAVVSVLVGRLSFGMTGLAVLLLVVERTGSYTRAGLAAAAYAVTLAIVTPLRSRRVDKAGQTTVLRVTGVIHPLGMAAFLAAILAGAPTAAYLPLLVIAAAAVPPLGSVMRALWADLAPDEPTRASAYAHEAVLIELAFVLGPLLVGVLSALFGPAVAVAVAAAAGGGGALSLSRTAVSRRWRPDTAPERHRLLGPLVSPGVRVVLGAFAFTGASFGAVEVAVPALVEAAGHPSSRGGLLLSIWAAGSAFGGLLYGARESSSPVDRTYVGLLGLLAAGAVLPLLAPGIIELAVLLFVYGLAIAPSGACATLLLSRHAPPGTVTEAFGWMTTAIFVGASVGNAMAGVAVEALAPRAGFVLTTVFGAAAFTVGLAGRSRLAMAPAG